MVCEPAERVERVHSRNPERAERVNLGFTLVKHVFDIDEHEIHTLRNQSRQSASSACTPETPSAQSAQI